MLWEPPFSEYIAYIGFIGLCLAAAGVWFILKRRQKGGVALVLALVGVFLALGAYNPVYYLLYKIVPGISLFRAPARWLLLYSFGTALLVGLGIEALTKKVRWQSVLTLVLVAELFVAGQSQALNELASSADARQTSTVVLDLAGDDFGGEIRT